MSATKDPPSVAPVEDGRGARFLKNVPLLAGLSDELRVALREQMEAVNLSGGEWLFHQGDAEDGLYLMRWGRVEVLDESDPSSLRRLRVMARGEFLGELALLTGAPRSAGVRALRDSRLLRMDRVVFEAAINQQPEVGVLVATELARRLQQPPSRGVRAEPMSVLAVLELGDGEGAALSDAVLQEELKSRVSVGVLDARAGGGVTHRQRQLQLEAMEREYNLTLLICRRGDDEEWRAFCLRQCDRVLVLGGGLPPAQLPALGGVVDLVLVRPARARLLAWLDRIESPGLHILDSTSRTSAALQRTVRRLLGSSVGLVLSGGGARSLAHLGALRVLRDAGVVFDRFAGVSMGALLAALLASGREIEEVVPLCRREFVERDPFNDFTLPVVSLIRSGKAEEMLERMFGHTLIEEMTQPYLCVSADLVAASQVCHQRGLLLRAVGASMSLPGIAPPVIAKDGHLLVDGGVLNHLPTRELAQAQEGPLVACDLALSGKGRGLPPAPIPRIVRRFLPRKVELPTITQVLARASMLGGLRDAPERRRLADLSIVTSTPDIGFFDWARMAEALRAGEEAAQAALQTPEGEAVLQTLLNPSFSRLRGR